MRLLTSILMRRWKRRNALIRSLRQWMSLLAKGWVQSPFSLWLIRSEWPFQLAKSAPLLGVPFTCKDNIWNKSFVTGAGSSYLINGSVPAKEDATVVKRYEKRAIRKRNEWIVALEGWKRRGPFWSRSAWCPIWDWVGLAMIPVTESPTIRTTRDG